MKNQKYSFVVLVGLVAVPLWVQPAPIIVTSQELNEEMRHFRGGPETLYLVNVLPKHVYADCSIPQSINIPLHQLKSKVQKWRWPKNRNIVVYCAGQKCPLAHHAHQQLTDLGFTRVRLFEGGLRDWKKQNFITIGACKGGYLQG